MPRVHFVKSARKAQKAHGIKKGDSYYWWKFRYGGKRVSKTMPRSSQLTQSEFLGEMYSIQEEFDDISRDGSPSDVASEINACAERIDEVVSTLEDKQSNLENAFPSGCPTLEQIKERLYQCETLKDELETCAGEVEGIDDLEERKKSPDGKSDEELQSEMHDEIENVMSNVNWEFS